MNWIKSFCGAFPHHSFGIVGAAVLVLLVAPLESHAQDTLIYAPLPLTNAESVVAQSRDLVRYIEHSLGLTIVIQYEPDYATILDKFARGEIHLVHLGPLPYIVLRAVTSSAEPLVFFREPDGQASYTCSLATAMDSNTEPATTEGPVALTQALSTCGFLITQHLLGSAGRDLNQLPYMYLGSHEEVALALVRGEFAIGGVKTVIGQGYEHIGLRLVMEGPEYPGFALVANSQLLDENTREDLAKLLSATPDKVFDDWQGLGRWGMVKASDSAYNELRCLEAIATMPSCGGLDCAVLQALQHDLCEALP